MSFDLHNDAGDHLKCSNVFWWKVVDLARANGWHPRGAEPAPGCTGRNSWRDTDATYMTNDFQTVTRADAQSLANALETALQEIPDLPVRTYVADPSVV